MELNKLKVYFLLFRFSFSISAFTFGGGYVVIPMMRKYFVKDLKLISEQELLEMAAIAQSTPGAIAVNIAVLVGYRISGLKGAVITCIGTILPPIMILSIISFFYQSFRDNNIISSLLKGMEAGVAATIVDLLIDMWQGVLKEKNLLLTLMAPFAFLANFVFNVNVLYIIIFCSVLCLAQSFIKNKLGGVESE
ncbi:MAG: chromate transporter [Finegoldia magna]|uniref:chromate transporter n=1 Tax=Desemzia incerta TaxID=82801 RepID=UPI00290549AF|nr:chromate transporter [Finegoldia magna]